MARSGSGIGTRMGSPLEPEPKAEEKLREAASKLSLAQLKKLASGHETDPQGFSDFD